MWRSRALRLILIGWPGSSVLSISPAADSYTNAALHHRYVRLNGVTGPVLAKDTDLATTAFSHNTR
jgi:hypothetical protein